MQQESASDDENQGFDAEAVAQWVDETARQKQVSQGAVVDELLSSYRALEELSAVVAGVGGAEREQAAGNEVEQPAESSGGGQQESPATGEPQDVESVAPSAEFAELKAELQELQTAIEQLAVEQQPQAESRTADATTDSEFLWLESQFEQFSSATNRRHAETAATVQQLSEQVDSIRQRLTALESTLDSDRSLSELEAAIQDLRTTQTEFDGRLESEFDNIEGVLQHLLATDDDIEQRLDELREDRQQAVKPLHQQRARYNQLVTLKHEAIRHGISKADCESCGLTVELGLLADPHCPSCKRRVTGIEDGGPLPFASATLRTAELSR